MTIDKERLRVLAEAATPGPWILLPVEDGSPYLRVRGTRLGARYKVANVLAPTYFMPRDGIESTANAEFIAAARDAVPALLSENAALAAEVERLRKDHAAALGLVADVRFALGDNGKRMQPELIEWATGLRRDAERYQWLRDAYNRPSDEVDEDGAFVVGGIARIMVRTSTYDDATALALDELDAAIDAAMTKKDAAP